MMLPVSWGSSPGQGRLDEVYRGGCSIRDTQMCPTLGVQYTADRCYRPLYTMHTWWARLLGSVFRTIALYASPTVSILHAVCGIRET